MFRPSPSLSLFLAIALACGLVSCHRPAASVSAGKAYPLDVCLISGKKLGDHGDPYVFTRDGQQVKLCCESCLDEFNANADKLMKQLASSATP